MTDPHYDDLDQNADAPEGSFQEVEPTTQDELDELDTEQPEMD